MMWLFQGLKNFPARLVLAVWLVIVYVIGLQTDVHSKNCVSCFEVFDNLDFQVLKSSNYSNDFTLSLSYDPVETLPPGISSHEIAVFEVSSVTEAYSKYGLFSLFFSCTASDLNFCSLSSV